jgi:hypothetical protein
VPPRNVHYTDADVWPARRANLKRHPCLPPETAPKCDPIPGGQYVSTVTSRSGSTARLLPLCGEDLQRAELLSESARRALGAETRELIALSAHSGRPICHKGAAAAFDLSRGRRLASTHGCSGKRGPARAVGYGRTPARGRGSRVRQPRVRRQVGRRGHGRRPVLVP